MSDLGKFEKSDLMPEIVTAKNEYVTISHRSEKTITGAGSSQSTAYEESTDPGQVQVVLLGKPERQCVRELHTSPRNAAGKGALRLHLVLVL